MKFFSKDKQVKKDLIRIKELIEEYGWIQGELGSQEQGFCLLGATSFYLDNEEHVYDLVRSNKIWETLGARVEGSIVGWNDAPNRTKQEVINLLDEAIASV